MALISIASADSITVIAPVCEISGTATINTIVGVRDGQVLKIWPTEAWAFGAAGNIVGSTVAQVSGTPVFLFCRGGLLTQISVVGYASTGTGDLVRATSPTIVTPVIASFATAQHDHEDAAGGGQLTSAALSGVSGSGNVVLAVTPTIDDPTITTRIRLPGPVYIYSGTGAPGFVAPKGSTFQRSDGGAGTCFYVNEDGTGGGWVAK